LSEPNFLYCGDNLDVLRRHVRAALPALLSGVGRRDLGSLAAGLL